MQNSIANKILTVGINGQILPPPKICPKRSEAKNVFVFLPAYSPKRGSPAGCGTGGRGEDSASLPDRASCFFD